MSQTFTTQFHLEVFGRERADGDVDILHVESGEAATRLDRPSVYPVGSDLSVKHEHPRGIVLSREDAGALGIPIE